MTKARAIDLMSKTVALVVNFSLPGDEKKVSTSQVEVEADKTWLKVRKKLFESAEYDAVRHYDSETKGRLDSWALPSLLKRGIYLLPIPLVKEASEYLKQRANERRYLVEQFVGMYRKHVKEAKAALRELFDQADYLSEGQLYASFKFSWQFVSFNTPASLEQISRELYEEEKKKAEAKWVEASHAVQQLLRENLSELVSHLVERLTPGEDGKRRVFRNTAVTRIQEFLQTFDVRNVTDDAELAAIVSRARKLVKDVNADQLRSEDALRDAVKDGFSKIQKAMEGMIEAKPRRAISLEDVA